MPDDICHRIGFTGTGYTKKGLELVALFKTFYQFFDCLWLVACGAYCDTNSKCSM